MTYIQFVCPLVCYGLLTCFCMLLEILAYLLARCNLNFVVSDFLNTVNDFRLFTTVIITHSSTHEFHRLAYPVLLFLCTHPSLIIPCLFVTPIVRCNLNFSPIWSLAATSILHPPISSIPWIASVHSLLYSLLLIHTRPPSTRMVHYSILIYLPVIVYSLPFRRTNRLLRCSKSRRDTLYRFVPICH